MWLVRPALLDDATQILEIAGAAGSETARLSSTLPKQREVLAAKINHSLASLAGTSATSGLPARFLFVLVDTVTEKFTARRVSMPARVMASRFITIAVMRLFMPPTSWASPAGLMCFIPAMV